MPQLYLIVIIISLVIGGLSSWYVNSSIKKFRQAPTSTDLTGKQIAENMLEHYGVKDVTIRRGRANQNHFNPRKNSITLDPHAFRKSSVTAIATACHEVGHACQYAQGYFPMKIRSVLVPVVTFTQGSWFLILIIGVALNIAGLVDLALAFYAVSVVFHAITLPVEFDASRRALEYMTEIGIAEEEKSGAQTVLRACALTYVATALISVIYLLYRAIRHRRIK